VNISLIYGDKANPITSREPPARETAEDRPYLESSRAECFGGEGLALETFKLRPGPAPPAKFNAEGGLFERWFAADPLKRERQLGVEEIEYRTVCNVVYDSWEAAIRRRRSAELLGAALVFLACGAAAQWWY
jgi:hypothetical protein